MTRATEHKLGDRNQHIVNMLLAGHTHWHLVVNAARKGQSATLIEALYSQQTLIHNVLKQLERIQ